MRLNQIENRTKILENFDQQLQLMTSSLFTDYEQPNLQLFDLDPKMNFNADYQNRKLSRNKRSSCPGGVGNFGFNSFNFMTFVLLTLNAVANTNNNINNNNNNNVNINYNTVNQDSNNVVSNSENMNMVTATILPVPGRRSLELLNK